MTEQGREREKEGSKRPVSTWVDSWLNGPLSSLGSTALKAESTQKEENLRWAHCLIQSQEASGVRGHHLHWWHPVCSPFRTLPGPTPPLTHLLPTMPGSGCFHITNNFF
uniref:Uncharacterized protein n=1 Tax=Mustela putorius furo TaxID=9669 RepID=M3XZY8_MUSPF